VAKKDPLKELWKIASQSSFFVRFGDDVAGAAVLMDIFPCVSL
jgi:hypothetical protein